MSNRTVFVFGSNEAGIHGAGAALEAFRNHGAVIGKGFGHYDNYPKSSSFAIPTKDMDLMTLPLDIIKDYVKVFLRYATVHKKLTFKVTCIGCGLAGLKHEVMAPLFKDAPKNCQFDELWKPYLGPDKTYWGTYG